jgi:hypothetical protein
MWEERPDQRIGPPVEIEHYPLVYPAMLLRPASG